LTTQNDVSVKNTAHGVGNRLVQIVAFHQNRVEAGDRTALTGSTPFKQLRQDRIDRRRKPAGRRPLTAGQTDLPLSPGKAGNRVKHQQYVAPLITEKLRHRCGHIRRP
jgi:hypothetical protein